MSVSDHVQPGHGPAGSVCLPPGNHQGLAQLSRRHPELWTRQGTPSPGECVSECVGFDSVLVAIILKSGFIGFSQF